VRWSEASDKSYFLTLYSCYRTIHPNPTALSQPNTKSYQQIITTEAQRLGFEFVGFAKAEQLDAPARKLEAWLNQNAHGKMAYMANHFDLRIDPTKLVPGAKSVICLTFNYHNPEQQTDPTAPKIASYAYGRDYHLVLKERLHQLLAHMQEQIGEIDGRCFVDSAPVMEREWAQRAGLGWNGKHTLTLHPRRGSWFFLAEIICDLDLTGTYADPISDHCGTCRRCIDACPTEAISPQGYLLDASRCISYLTIELREAIPTEHKTQMEGWAFGCDICQQVCPWNRFSERHTEPQFEPHPDLLSLDRQGWIEMTEATFGRLFKQSAVKRVKYDGLMENVRFLDDVR
jgi:epoxyqueuosine reductase